jgi:uncharacterized protein (DUF952 family)
MSVILHIVNRDDWEKAVAIGYYKPSSLDNDGFIHCSTTEQTVDTANQFYPNKKGLVLLCIDQNKLNAELKYEGPACEGDERNSQLFPHIYGKLNVSAVINVVDFEPNNDGVFTLPEAIKKY